MRTRSLSRSARASTPPRARSRFARWVRSFVIVGTFVPALTIPQLPTTTLTGNAYYEFLNTGASGVPWNASSFESALGNATLSGTPSVINGNGVTALAARLASGDLVLYQQNASGRSSLVDLTTGLATPSPDADPVAFFDPWHNVDIVYVSDSGDLMLITPAVALGVRHAAVRAATPFTVSDLTTSNKITFAAGSPSIDVTGTSGTLVARDALGHAEAMSLQWPTSNRAPVVGLPVDVTAATATLTLTSNPVLLPTTAGTALFSAVVTGGDIVVYQESSSGTWSTINVTTTSGAPNAVGGVAANANATTSYLAALTAAGDVELFSVAAGSELGGLRSPHVIGQPSTTWNYVNLNTTVAGSPPLAGQLALTATGTSISVAGEAANWGDLFLFNSPLPTVSWSDVDLSVTASNSAITVGPGISATTMNGELALFGFATGYTASRGVGVYAIPQKDWGQAITDGWPILADTGALGTSKAPWVGFVTSGGLAQSPDYLLGQAIANGHHPETWLSFWTVSGPMPGQPKTTANYYSHGYLAGAWVAQQIDGYKKLGLTNVPNWIILDPEGLPDNHSALDAPSGASNATIATYATYWTAMLRGWAAGMSSVDPALHPGVYAAMSEYRNYGLASDPLPVFEAVAFAGNGPVPIKGGSGANVLGYIAFDATCTPASTLHAQEKTLLSPPWSGQFNTLQFNAGVYCKP